VSKKRDAKSPASVLQRLRNACVDGQSVQNAQVIFVLERFLARVARSPYQDRLVLKGGILLYLMLGQWVRPTEDLDFLAVRLPSESLDQVLAEILAVDTEDGLAFDAAGMTSEEIREDSGYPCRRYKIPYRFGTKHVHFIKLDLSFGDPVTPGPQAIEVRPILDDFQSGKVLGYPIETLLAEKVETLLVRGLANTRSKDIFDLWALARNRKDLQLASIGLALAATAAHRGSTLSLEGAALLPSFCMDARQAQLWKGFVRSKSLAAPDFPEVMAVVQTFVAPMVAMAIHGGNDRSWDPGSLQWQ
jgi:predicted nucleotidyltransferase component of viral defense system